MTDPFDFDTPPLRFAVMGNPVSHSKSPQIHQLFAKQFGLRIEYQRIQVDPGGFDQAVDHFQANAGRGLNITIPFKQEAWRLVDHKTQRAELATAVNTVRFETDGSLFGDNTDGVGLIRDITYNLEQEIVDKRILVIGAGGAARGILGPLLETGPEELIVTNRTVDKAHVLQDHFVSLGNIQARGFDQLAESDFDIVINATASSLGNEKLPLPETLFRTNALAYDLMYANEPTPFMHWAAGNGAMKTADGLGMLVEQAAESFYLWNDKRPQTSAVISTLSS